MDDSLNSICARPTHNLNEDRNSDKPLVRALSEEDLWLRTTLAFGLGLTCSYFKML